MNKKLFVLLFAVVMGVAGYLKFSANDVKARINIGITIIDNRSDTMLHQALYDG